MASNWSQNAEWNPARLVTQTIIAHILAINRAPLRWLPTTPALTQITHPSRARPKSVAPCATHSASPPDTAWYWSRSANCSPLIALHDSPASSGLRKRVQMAQMLADRAGPGNSASAARSAAMLVQRRLLRHCLTAKATCVGLRSDKRAVAATIECRRQYHNRHPTGCGFRPQRQLQTTGRCVLCTSTTRSPAGAAGTQRVH